MKKPLKSMGGFIFNYRQVVGLLRLVTNSSNSESIVVINNVFDVVFVTELILIFKADIFAFYSLEIVEDEFDCSIS